eukprot:jgi/Astpho2/8819/fgenesh1_pg.00129_%23_17_t
MLAAQLPWRCCWAGRTFSPCLFPWQFPQGSNKTSIFPSTPSSSAPKRPLNRWRSPTIHPITMSYEEQRAQRIAENKKRMREMQLSQISSTLAQGLAAKRKAQSKPRSAPAPKVMCFVEPRRSSRREGQPAVSYSESVLDLVDAPVRRRGGKGRTVVGELRPGATEEVYTQEHVRLLGDYQEPWELFVDGYDPSTGKRVYDKVNGMTCHQCRQKTLGHHTSCSSCSSLQGVLCGDCLYMRYGENITEVQAKPDWMCPVCRDLCNCSFHRIKKGWAPTGTLYRRALAEGYKSVAHYLVLSQQAGAQPAAEGVDVQAAAPAAEAEQASGAEAAPAADDMVAAAPVAAGLSKLALYMQMMMRQALRHRNKTQQTGALRAQPP